MKRNVAKQIEIVNSIAARQDCPTSPTGFVMHDAECVMVALPHPWPREVAAKEAERLLTLTPSILECLGMAPISDAKKEHLKQLYQPRPAFWHIDKHHNKILTHLTQS